MGKNLVKLSDQTISLLLNQKSAAKAKGNTESYDDIINRLLVEEDERCKLKELLGKNPRKKK